MLDQVFVPVVNHLLTAAPWARERLQPHAGLSARFDAPPMTVAFAISSAGDLLLCDGQTPDVTLSVPFGTLPRFALDGFEETMHKVHLQGNAEFADALGFVFRNLRWDIEEDLSRVLGDVVAHRLTGSLRSAADTPRRMMRGSTANLIEYLTEERPMLVSVPTGARFDDDLRSLRDAVARIEKRIDRISRITAGKGVGG